MELLLFLFYVSKLQVHKGVAFICEILKKGKSNLSSHIQSVMETFWAQLYTSQWKYYSEKKKVSLTSLVIRVVATIDKCIKNMFVMKIIIFR